MSDILGKTLGSIQNIISGASSGYYSSNSKNSSEEKQWSRRFINFVEAVSSLDSKYEESQLVDRAICLLKQSFSRPGIKLRDYRDCLAQAVLCHLLGYDVRFAHIHAIKMADHNNFSVKRMGYLAISLFMNSEHELNILLVNTLQKDLRSHNIVEVCLALGVMSDLMYDELISILLPLVEDKLSHPDPMVRKKAVYCIHKAAIKNPKSVEHLNAKLLRSFSDHDPSIMMASLTALLPFIQLDPDNYRHLVSPLIKIQHQIINRRLPNVYNYHSVPVPWCQILILKSLSALGKNDQQSSQQILSILKDTLMQAGQNENISFAIMCECIETLSNIEASNDLIETALSSVASLLRSSDPNLKYMGLCSLTSIVTKVKKCFASKHQPAVIECLNHSDTSIRLKTLELLYRLCNPSNVTIICAKFMEMLRSDVDPYQKSVIADRIMCLADKYRPSFVWYLDTIDDVSMTNSIDPSSSHMVNVVWNNIDDALTEDVDAAVWRQILEKYVRKCEEDFDRLPDSMLLLMSWIFHKSINAPATSVSSEVVLRSLRCLVKSSVRQQSSDVVLLCLLTSFLRIVIHRGDRCSEDVVDDVVSQCRGHQNFVIRQIADEIKRTVEVLDELSRCRIGQNILSSAPIDPLLSHQDDLVIESLENGGRPYVKRSFVVNRSACFTSGACKQTDAVSSLKSSYHSDGASGSSENSSLCNRSSCMSISGSVPKNSNASRNNADKKFNWTSEGFKKSSETDTIDPEVDSANESDKLAEQLFAGVDKS